MACRRPRSGIATAHTSTRKLWARRAPLQPQGANMSKARPSNRMALMASSVYRAVFVWIGGGFVLGWALLGTGCAIDDSPGGGPTPAHDGSVQDGAGGTGSAAPDRAAPEAAT